MRTLGDERKARLGFYKESREAPWPTSACHALDKSEADLWPIRTLVVDDSPIVLKALNLFLERLNGFQVVGTATDGDHAVRRVVELEPDLVLMDVQLPGMNGLEVTRQIKARLQAPAVVVLTAEDTPEWRAAARRAGTDGFVGKQYMLTELREALRKLFPATMP